MTYQHPLRRRFPAILAVPILVVIIPLLDCRSRDPVEQREAAKQLRESGSPADAAIILNELHLASPDDPGLLYELALALHEAGDHQDALKAADEVIEASPAAIDARMLRARILAEMGRDQEALRALRALAAGTPGRAGVHRAMGRIHASARGKDQCLVPYPTPTR